MNINPQIFNFNVQDGQPIRIYFDSSKIIQVGINGYVGFKLGNDSGVKINGVTIQSGLTTGHYFTLDTSLNHYDNWAIRYEGGGDMQDLDSNPLFKMYLTYIVNNIVEPPAATNKYVTTLASGGDGSIGSPWTLAEAGTNAIAGETVWIKQGIYNSTLSVSNSGTLANPIKFIGYTSTIGDINTYMVDTFVYTSNAQATAFIDSSTYPVITGTNTLSQTGVITSQSYLIFKNICTNDKDYGYQQNSSASNIVFENCLSGNSYVTDAANGRGWDSNTLTTKIRLLKCISFDGALANINLDGDNHLIESTKTASGDTGSTDSGTDYYITSNRFNSGIVRNSEAIRTRLDGHRGHGIGSKAYSGETTNNSLYELNYIEDMDDEALFIAYPLASFNVFRNNESIGEVRGSTGCKQISIRDGTHHNIFISNKLKTGGAGIYLADTSEEGNNGMVNDNLIFNNIIEDCTYSLFALSVYGNTQTYGGNKITNNTFDNNGVFIRANATDDGTNEIKNNIINGSSTHYSASGITDTISETYNDYWNFWGTNGTPEAGTGNISVDPQFSPFPKVTNNALNAGIAIDGNEYDIDGNQRSNPPTIGSVQIVVNSDGSVTLTWTNSDTVGVTETVVYRDDVEVARILVANPSEYIDTTVISGNTYKYEVQAVDPNGESVQEVDGVNVTSILIP